MTLWDYGARRGAATLGEAAVVLEAHPAAMQLRVLSTMAEVTSERNSTLIFPLPIELFRLVDTMRGNGQPTCGPGPARVSTDADRSVTAAGAPEKAPG